MMDNELTEFFGEPIHVYTRAQAIEDGALIDITDTAREVGLAAPTAMTQGLWADCVAWNEADNDRKGTLQDEAGRLWDCVWMAINAARRHPNASRCTVVVHRVPRDGRGQQPRPVQFQLVISGGDNGEMVFTLQMPGED